MKKIVINGISGDSGVFIGETISNLEKYIPGSNNIVIITDNIVRKIYGDFFDKYKVIEIGTGEGIKNLTTINNIFEKLIEYEADRTSYIVGIGGGIVCDIAGFVASTYMRGIRFGFIASTLLAQVDASIGGKNGVNYQGYKNMIGVFRQPEFVICDPDLLGTLPEKELLCGFAEIVKHTVIGNAGMFKFLEENYDKALNLDKEIIEKLVYDSLLIKSSIVNEDEKEKGERRKLNFGHTFGHALEKVSGITHGEAVSIGMIFASALSVKKELLSPEDARRIEILLNNMGLPVKMEADKDKVIDAIRRDKKREQDIIHFVLLDKIGNAVIKEISVDELEGLID